MTEDTSDVQNAREAKRKHKCRTSSSTFLTSLHTQPLCHITALLLYLKVFYFCMALSSTGIKFYNVHFVFSYWFLLKRTQAWATAWPAFHYRLYCAATCWPKNKQNQARLTSLYCPLLVGVGNTKSSCGTAALVSLSSFNNYSSQQQAPPSERTVWTVLQMGAIKTPNDITASVCKQWVFTVYIRIHATVVKRHRVTEQHVPYLLK